MNNALSSLLIPPHTKVKPSSLPHSLRALSTGEAIYTARDIARFLQAACTSMGKTDNITPQEARGGEICFDLLLDYLDIATGEYAFPLVGGSDSPELCQRKG